MASCPDQIIQKTHLESIYAPVPHAPNCNHFVVEKSFRTTYCIGARSEPFDSIAIAGTGVVRMRAVDPDHGAGSQGEHM